MIKKLLLLLPLLISHLPSWAQADYRSGYVVLLSGDTLRGQIDFRGERRNSTFCRFRRAETAAATDYYPEKLRAYGLAGGAQFQTVTLRLEQPVNLLTARPDTIPQPVFLEKLVLGPASLYYLHDREDASRYFLRVGEAPYRELVQRTVDVTVNGATVRRKTDEFRRVLAASMRQCYAVQQELARLPFEHNALINVVRHYNQYMGGQSVVPPSAERRIQARLAAVAGVQSSTLTYRAYGTSNSVAARIRDVAWLQPVLGLALHLHMPSLNPNLSARIEALYDYQRFGNSRADYAGGMQEEYRTHLSSVQLPIFLRYTLPKGQFRPFAQVGFMPRQLVLVQSEYRAKTTTANEYSPWATLVQDPRRFELGYGASAGIVGQQANGRSVSAELRFERSNGFSNMADLQINQSRWYVLLSYDLTK